MEKKRKIFWLSFGIPSAAILAIGIFVNLLNINAPPPRLSEPTNLQVINIGTNKDLLVDKNNNAKEYYFLIKNNRGSQVACSSANRIDATAFLQRPGNYSIYCKYAAEIPAGSSQFVGISYTTYHQIKSPQVSIADGKLNIFLSDTFFDAVNLEVTLYYSSGKNIKTSTNFTPATNNSPQNNLGILMGHFDLESILPSGTFALSVQIKADNQFYLASNLIPQVAFTN